MRRLGAKSIVALVVPETEVAYKILALNTEKAHNLREKALEVIRMARDLAGRGDPAPETPVRDRVRGAGVPDARRLLRAERTVSRRRLPSGLEARGRVPGRAARPRALAIREARAARVAELEEAVSAAIAGLKERGFESPYLRAFVVARINPLRFHKGAMPSFDATLEKMIGAARKFKPESVKAEQVARAAGAPGEPASE